MTAVRSATGAWQACDASASSIHSPMGAEYIFPSGGYYTRRLFETGFYRKVAGPKINSKP
jgi:hypothetical protein